MEAESFSNNLFLVLINLCSPQYSYNQDGEESGISTILRNFLFYLDRALKHMGFKMALIDLFIN